MPGRDAGRHAGPPHLNPRLREQMMRPDFTFISPTVKWLMFGFNFAFWLIGGVLIFLGLWAYVIKRESRETTAQSGKVDSLVQFLLTPSVVVITLGCVLFSLGFCAWVGALRENVFLLKLFHRSLALILLVQLILAVAALSLHTVVRERLEDHLRSRVIEDYRDEAEMENFINIIQIEFQCCGVSRVSDWSENRYFNCTPSNRSPERCAVPYSCCKQPYDPDTRLINIFCGYGVQNVSFAGRHKVVHVVGCLDSIYGFIKRHLQVVAGVALGCTIIQVTGIYLAKKLEGQIEQQMALYKFNTRDRNMPT